MGRGEDADPKRRGELIFVHATAVSFTHLPVSACCSSLVFCDPVRLPAIPTPNHGERGNPARLLRDFRGATSCASVVELQLSAFGGAKLTTASCTDAGPPRCTTLA